MVGNGCFELIGIGWELVAGDEPKINLLFSKAVDLLVNKELTVDEIPVYISFFKYASRVWLVAFGNG